MNIKQSPTTSQPSNFLQSLTDISPRRGNGEAQAAKIIKQSLQKANITFLTQEFKTKIPQTIKATLFADDREIPCIGASFYNGKFDKPSKILSSIGAKSDEPFITFHPHSHGICLQGYKEVPALTINRDSVVDLILAKEVTGELLVEELEFTSTNILVGNATNPTNVIFAHYDSIVGAGAIDNAGAVEVLYRSIIENKELLTKNLFVFVGSEEESISRPDGCYGFEVFDNKYFSILDNAKRIIVLDGIGITEPSITNDNVDWVFYISRLSLLEEKVFWMLNDQSIVMKYYHSQLDTLDRLIPKHLEEAKALLVSVLQ